MRFVVGNVELQQFILRVLWLVPYPLFHAHEDPNKLE